MGNAMPNAPRSPFSLPRSSSSRREDKSVDSSPTVFTSSELAQFTGEKKQPIYISLASVVYDASSMREVYGPGGESHHLAGKDASRALALSSFSARDLNDLELSDLGGAQLRQLDTWVKRFREEYNFPVVGRLILKQDMTKEELRRFNGVDNVRHTCLVALNGVIYDVTANGWDHYGPDGTYSLFAGRDASVALARMSLDPEVLDDANLDELTEEERKTLADWSTRFQQKYSVVGKLLD
ncbi:hypothetical protein P43SY_004162 [Pythium insidiosum]|uniref:Cytochrome b5 heme-binding domain-containing protein n=1 Tax=Pythium insidiosum TaxID=114742 RepID=A0AAD5LWW2_PYTIN|nr:hypothetical protein P43SY_004162 [Pythium insidiosum]